MMEVVRKLSTQERPVFLLTNCALLPSVRTEVTEPRPALTDASNVLPREKRLHAAPLLGTAEHYGLVLEFGQANPHWAHAEGIAVAGGALPPAIGVLNDQDSGVDLAADF